MQCVYHHQLHSSHSFYFGISSFRYCLTLAGYGSATLALFNNSGRIQHQDQYMCLQNEREIHIIMSYYREFLVLLHDCNNISSGGIPAGMKPVSSLE